jgi:hypothetical protein
MLNLSLKPTSTARAKVSLNGDTVEEFLREKINFMRLKDGSMSYTTARNGGGAEYYFR